MGGETLDMVIVGAGPAGLSAAVNAKARNVKATVIDLREPVAKVKSYPEVTNYLGLCRAAGKVMARHFAQHFSRTGYPFHKEKVLRIIPQEGENLVCTDKGAYTARTVLLTVGVSQSKVLPGEEEFLGKGVSYCVTCDGALFRGKDVVVVGFTSEGEEEANSLAGFARQVIYVATYPHVEVLEPSVKVLHTKPLAIQGDGHVHTLRTEDGELRADGIFILREAIPLNTIIEGLEMSSHYIKVDREMATNIAGVYAAGDCTGPPFQIAKAVGEGQIAALSAVRFIYMQRKKER